METIERIKNLYGGSTKEGILNHIEAYIPKCVSCNQKTFNQLVYTYECFNDIFDDVFVPCCEDCVDDRYVIDNKITESIWDVEINEVGININNQILL